MASRNANRRRKERVRRHQAYAWTPATEERRERKGDGRTGETLMSERMRQAMEKAGWL